MNTEFWKLLRQHREFNGLSQSELKDRLDTQGYSFTESAISKWENGIHVPKAEVVEVLEDILMLLAEDHDLRKQMLRQMKGANRSLNLLALPIVISIVLAALWFLFSVVR